MRRNTVEAIEYVDKSFDISTAIYPILSNFIPWLSELHVELLEQSDKFKNMLRGFLSADRIFTVAAGRSELMIRSTGMRLMHEGYDVYRIMESYTPAIGNDSCKKDLLFFYSGSGQTKIVLTAEKKAKEKNVPIFGVSSNVDSEAARIAGIENVIITKGKIIHSNNLDSEKEIQPVNFLQTKSENKAFVVGELLVGAIAKAKSLTEEDFIKRHSNTE